MTPCYWKPFMSIHCTDTVLRVVWFSILFRIIACYSLICPKHALPELQIIWIILTFCLVKAVLFLWMIQYDEPSVFALVKSSVYDKLECSYVCLPWECSKGVFSLPWRNPAIIWWLHGVFLRMAYVAFYLLEWWKIKKAHLPMKQLLSVFKFKISPKIGNDI